VQYNFVQHFSGPAPIFSEDSLREPEASESTGEAQENVTDALHRWLVKSGFGCSCCSSADDDLFDQHQVGRRRSRRSRRSRSRRRRRRRGTGGEEGGVGGGYSRTMQSKRRFKNST